GALAEWPWRRDVDGPVEVVPLQQEFDDPHEIAVVNPRHELSTTSNRAAEAAACQAQQQVQRTATVRTHHDGAAESYLPGGGSICLVDGAFPRQSDLDALPPVERHARLVAADAPGRLVVRGVEAVRVDSCSAHLQPHAWGTRRLSDRPTHSPR